jgi:hypothetical protein
MRHISFGVVWELVGYKLKKTSLQMHELLTRGGRAPGLVNGGRPTGTMCLGRSA